VHLDPIVLRFLLPAITRYVDTVSNLQQSPWALAQGPGTGSEDHSAMNAYQITTRRSYEHEASRLPNLGCAHATCHTGPS